MTPEQQMARRPARPARCVIAVIAVLLPSTGCQRSPLTAADEPQGSATARDLVMEPADMTVLLDLTPRPGLALAFSQAPPTPTLEAPQFLAAGDFNQDGRLDCAVASTTAQAGLAVHLAVANGRIGNLVSFGLGRTSSGIAVGDFDGDHRDDLVSLGPSGYTVFLGAGGGAFRPLQETKFNGRGIGVGTADFDRDGHVDLTIAGVFDSSSALSWFHGVGDGTFAAGMVFKGGQSAASLVIADYDRDGRNDVLVGDETAPPLLAFLGSGDGRFSMPVISQAQKGAAWIATGDFDLDGILDVAMTAYAQGSVTVLRGAAGGNFRDPVAFSIAGFPAAQVVATDFDLDGRADLAVAAESGSITILRSLGNGSFAEPVSISIGGKPRALAVGDIDGDGKPDLFVADHAQQNLVGVRNVSH